MILLSLNHYNKLKGYDLLSYKVISYLIENNEDIWKMLKYNTPDALSKSNLTQEEKASLIYSGETDSEPFKVFRDPFTDDVFTEQVCQLRIFPNSTYPENRIMSIQDICIQIVCHVKINYLDDYVIRLDRIIYELINTLNGSDIGTVGQFYFDRERSRSNNIMRGIS